MYDSHFYTFISESGSLIAQIYGIVDNEMTQIYAKQLILLFKKIGILFVESGRVKINKEYDWDNFNNKIYEAFWNYSDWAGLFPSLPEAAERIYKQRRNLQSIILSYEYPQYIDKICLEDK